MDKRVRVYLRCRLSLSYFNFLYVYPDFLLLTKENSCWNRSKYFSNKKISTTATSHNDEDIRQLHNNLKQFFYTQIVRPSSTTYFSIIRCVRLVLLSAISNGHECKNINIILRCINSYLNAINNTERKEFFGN